MGKILLFYKYFSVAHPQGLVKEQRCLCEKLNLKGRVLIADEGINATLGGTDEAIDEYMSIMHADDRFADIDFKESEGTADYFPRLQVIAKKEIVHFGVSLEEAHPRDTGKHLTPQEAHALMEESPDDLVIFDARNNYESRVGLFKNAVTPNINHFRELREYIDEHLNDFTGKKVLMYCTGGIRCERATAYLKKKNVAQEVYQIAGGIHRYVEAYPQGFFKGKNYVFDGRVTQQVTEDTLATCEHCSTAYDEYNNCINAECNKQIIVCPACITLYHNTCSMRCKELVEERRVNIRTLPHKILIRQQK